MMGIRKDRDLILRALGEGIRTAAELALWLKRQSLGVQTSPQA